MFGRTLAKRFTQHPGLLHPLAHSHIHWEEDVRSNRTSASERPTCAVGTSEGKERPCSTPPYQVTKGHFCTIVQRPMDIGNVRLYEKPKSGGRHARFRINQHRHNERTTYSATRCTVPNRRTISTDERRTAIRTSACSTTACDSLQRSRRSNWHRKDKEYQSVTARPYMDPLRPQTIVIQKAPGKTLCTNMYERPPTPPIGKNATRKQSDGSTPNKFRNL